MTGGSGDEFRVLHVDDDRDLAELTATYLEREDDRFTVETATDADDGEEKLASGTFDCVVSDYDMPRRNGIEFLESVREEYPELPFILFTGKGSEEVASEAISAGVTDYLQKGGGTDRYTVLANRIVNAVEHYRSVRLVERSRERLREIVDSLPQSLFVVDEDGTYLLVNEALAEFHGRTVEEIEGSHVTELLDDRDVDQFLSDLEAVLESGEPKRVPEVELVDETGERRVFASRLLPYERAETDNRAALGISSDITDRKELERKNERLEGATGVVSHDLRAPLRTLRDALESAERTGDAEQFERAGHALDRMETMVEDLLTLSDRAETTLDRDRVDLSTLASERWAAVAPDEATLVAETDSEVRADRDRLARLLEGLFRNSVEPGSTSPRPQAPEDSAEHCPGDVTVTVGDCDGGFYVADDGPGVPSEVRERVFDSGFSAAPDAAGFGLAVVERIAEAHGWTVKLSEREEGGARFEVTGVETGS